MGKYIGSPWGEIRGKLDDAVGGVWKGISWVRVRILPTQRGTLDKYRAYKDGILPPHLFSFPQMNIRRASLQVLGYIARTNMSNWIVPVWERFVKEHGYVMTGTNAMVKRNAATLLGSMDREEEYDPTTNEVDLKVIAVSDGDLEPVAEFTKARYTAGTGALVLEWKKDVFTNGAITDHMYFMVAKKPVLESVGRDGSWLPKLFMFGTALDPEPPGVPIARDAEIWTTALPVGLDPTKLTAYLFCRDADNLIGYSISKSSIVTTP